MRRTARAGATDNPGVRVWRSERVHEDRPVVEAAPNRRRLRTPLGPRVGALPVPVHAGLGGVGAIDARSGQDLRTTARVAHLRAMRVDVQRALASGAAIEDVQRIASRAIEEVFVDVVAADLDRHGPAPGRFAVFVLGSVAAGEAGTHSDVDAAVVLEDGAHYAWFEAAVDRWRMAFTALGEPSGVTFCDQASPVGRYRDALFGDVASIAATWSDPERGASYRRALREGRFVLGDPLVMEAIDARIALARQPEVRRAKAEQDLAEATENLTRFARAEPFDQRVPLRAVRKAVLALLRGLADRLGLDATNGFERVDALRDAGVLDAELHADVRRVLEDVGRLRLLTQLKANCSMDEAATLDVIEDVLPRSLSPRPDLAEIGRRWTEVFARLGAQEWCHQAKLGFAVE